MRKRFLHHMNGAILMTVVVFLATIWSWPAVAQTPERLTLDPAHAPFEIVEHGRVFFETGKAESDWDTRLGVADLLALDETAFVPVTTRQIGFGWTEAIVHVRIPIENTSNDAQDWVLAFNQPIWGYRSVELVLDSVALPTRPVFVHSDEVPWDNSDRLVHTTFEMPPQSSGVLFVSYLNSSTSAAMSIETPDAYAQRRLVRDVTIYILLGLVLGVTFLTVSLIGVMHQRVALYYAAYVVGATVHLCYILDLFRPSPFLFSLTHPFRSYLWWAGISLVCYMLFQRAFFSNEARIGNGLRRSFAAVIVINAVLLLAHGVFQFPYEYYIACTMICMLFVAANGIVAVTRKITGGLFFALGCLSITFMVAPITLSDFMTAYYTYEEASMVFLYGLALEATALSCAMFLKVRQIRAEREDALLSELRLTNEKLEASRKLASAAHDIQQPLSSLRMALTDPSSDANKHGKIDQAIDYLDEIVRTQMAETKHDLTSHEEPEISNIEEFEIDLIFDNLQSMFTGEAQAKGLSLRVARTSKRATTSPLGLMRILSNLVSNAIKNTQSGGVVVGCRQSKSHVRIDVCDTGPGLTSAQIEDLQKPYRRNANYDGQGLGLSIVRQLCDEYDMSFRVSSKLNHGTVFHIIIPVAHQ